MINSKKNSLILIGGFLILGIPPLIYFLRFYYFSRFTLSSSTQVWSEFGGFLGGTIGPTLTFMTVFLLLNSLKYQYAANEKLEEQITDNKRYEALRAFETSFFSLSQCQSALFDNFKIKISHGGKGKLFNRSGIIKIHIEEGFSFIACNKTTIFQQEAVKFLEFDIQEKMRKGMAVNEIKKLYSSYNRSYNMYDIVRAFNVIVALVDSELSDNRNFTLDDRKNYYLKLIGITSFSHLILVCMTVQFFDSPISNNLRNHKDLNEVMDSVKLNFNLF